MDFENISEKEKSYLYTLIRRDRPMKIGEKDRFNIGRKCNSCKKYVMRYECANFCGICGQRIDWSE